MNDDTKQSQDTAGRHPSNCYCSAKVPLCLACLLRRKGTVVPSDDQPGDTTAARALRVYGRDPQIRQCMEELAELIAALNRHQRGRVDDAAVAEEIADVEIGCEQMRLLFDGVDAAKARKLARLSVRLDDRELVLRSVSSDADVRPEYPWPRAASPISPADCHGHDGPNPSSSMKLDGIISATKEMHGWAACVLGLTADQARDRGLDSMLSEIADHVPIARSASDRVIAALNEKLARAEADEKAARDRLRAHGEEFKGLQRRYHEALMKAKSASSEQRARDAWSDWDATDIEDEVGSIAKLSADVCESCGLRTAGEADRATVPQGESGGLCWARWGSQCPGPARWDGRGDPPAGLILVHADDILGRPRKG